MTTDDLKSFHYLENGDVSFSMYDTLKSTDKLCPGFYNVSAEYVAGVIKTNLRIDTNNENVRKISFNDIDKIEKLFESFFNKDVIEHMNKSGFNHKTGVLLHGKEGTGKSTVIRYYSNEMIKNNNAIVFYIDLTIYEYISHCWSFIRGVRKIQDNPIIIIFEEIDGMMREEDNKSFLKKILDGNLSIDNSIFMATTNYIDSIPDAIKNRPSRFKYVLNVDGIYNDEDIFIAMKCMIGHIFNDEDIVIFSREMNGKTIDCIKQFCIDKIMNLQTYDGIKGNKLGFSSKKKKD